MKEYFKFIDLFAGIGGFRIAFESVGGKCVFASEIDKYARKTYTHLYYNKEINENIIENNKEYHGLFGDITKIDKHKIPYFDILTAGFPCPTFSIAGVSKRKSLGLKHGLEDEQKGKLFFQIAEILEIKKPDGFLLENVKNLINHNCGKTIKIILEELDELGYKVTWDIFDAAKLVPQHRERVFIAGFKKELNINFDLSEVKIPDNKPKLKDILIPNNEVDEKYTISDKLWNYLQSYKKKHKNKGNGFGFNLADPEGVSSTMSARYHKDGSEILIEQEGKNPRMLTVEEASRLFGFPKEYLSLYNKKFKLPVSRTRAYKLLGNSVCVPIVKLIAENMVKSYLNLKNKKMNTTN